MGRGGAEEGGENCLSCVPGLVGYARLCPGDQYEVGPLSAGSCQGSPPCLWGSRVPATVRALGQVARAGAHLGQLNPPLLGPHPQVLMRLGRQRWKLKGRIESDDSQTWDEEEKAFIPTLHENFEIKVGGA